MPAPSSARLLAPALLGLALACLAAPAEASKKAGKTAPSPPLDLALRQGDLTTPPPRRPEGYAATLGEDPWRALEGHTAFGPEPGVPKRREALDGDDVRTEEVVLRKLLEGQTIPLIRLRTSPEPR